MLHGDAGAYAKRSQSSVLVVSAKSLLAKRWDANVIPGFMLPTWIDSDNTHALWAAWIHGLNAAFRGKHPPVDQFGHRWPPGSLEASRANRDLCGGHVRIVIWVLSADLDYLIWISLI